MMNAEKEHLLRVLRDFRLLQDVPEEQLSYLAGSLREERFPAGTEILREGEPGDRMFLLLEGEVDVLKRTVYGEPYVAATLCGGDHGTFGEMALVDQSERSATITARTGCRTLSLSYEAFRELCLRHPDAGVRVLLAVSRTLARDLRRENDNLRLVYQALIEEIENG